MQQQIESKKNLVRYLQSAFCWWKSGACCAGWGSTLRIKRDKGVLLVAYVVLGFGLDEHAPEPVRTMQPTRPTLASQAQVLGVTPATRVIDTCTDCLRWKMQGKGKGLGGKERHFIPAGSRKKHVHFSWFYSKKRKIKIAFKSKLRSEIT